MHDLALCAIFQNEAPYLKEWIEFHSLVGVQHFYLYNNLSTDPYLNILQPYITSGQVDLSDWPYQSVGHDDWTKLQCQTYENLIQRVKGEVIWLAFLDIDEFLFPVCENDLVNFLSGYRDYAAVCVNWQMYGTSKVSHIPEGKLMIETLLLKAPTDHEENRLVKPIVQPSRVVRVKNPHTFVYQSGDFQVNSNKEPFQGFLSPHIAIDKIRINHYWSKDENYFFKVKAPRRKKWGESASAMIARINTLNQVEDGAILRFIPALRQKVGL